MPEIQKPKVETYEYAAPEVQAAMNPFIFELEQGRTSPDVIAAFGNAAERKFHDSVQAIETLFKDPKAPAADQATCERLVQDFSDASAKMALVLGAGNEVLRRYEQEYLEQAADELMMTEAEPERKKIEALCQCRDALVERMKVLAQPETAHATVADLVDAIEQKRQFNNRLGTEGLSLEEPISVRKEPLRIKPQTP
jgi:hypothetical protein